MRTRAAILVMLLLAAAWWAVAHRGAAPVPPRVAEPSQSGIEERHANAPQAPADVPSERQPAIADQPQDPTMVAPSSSAPTLTYEGHLMQFIERSMIDGPLTSQVRLGSPSASSVIDDARFNPDRKEPNAAQMAALQGILTRYADEETRLMGADRTLCREALLAAVAKGQFLARSRPPLTEVDPERIAFAVRQDQERARRDHEEAVAELGGRLGKLMQDWAYSLCSTLEPDGVPRTTLVYYTRAQAPAVFAGRVRISELSGERTQELRQFFTALP